MIIHIFDLRDYQQVGAGNIGGTLAHLVGLKQLGDVSMVDAFPGVATGKALDLSHARAVEGLPGSVQVWR